MDYAHVESLVEDGDNARVHGANVERLADTIARVGWGAPLLVQRATRRVIAGHGRLRAARLLVERDPSWRCEPGAPIASVPVRWIDCDDDRAVALAVADNAAALQGHDDTQRLASQVARIANDLVATLRFDHLLRPAIECARAPVRAEMVAAIAPLVEHAGSHRALVDHAVEEWRQNGAFEHVSRDLRAGRVHLLIHATPEEHARLLEMLGNPELKRNDRYWVLWLPPESE